MSDKLDESFSASRANLELVAWYGAPPSGFRGCFPQQSLEMPHRVDECAYTLGALPFSHLGLLQSIRGAGRLTTVWGTEADAPLT